MERVELDLALSHAGWKFKVKKT